MLNIFFPFFPLLYGSLETFLLMNNNKERNIMKVCIFERYFITEKKEEENFRFHAEINE